MSDDHDDLYRLVRTEFEPVRLREGLDDITARGRGLRRRRHAGLAAGLTAVVAIAALALSAPTGVTTDWPAQMSLAASSVESEPDGTVRLTIRQLTDPDTLTAALKDAGVPALVELIQTPQALGGCVDYQGNLDEIRVKQPDEDEPGPKEDESAYVFVFRPDRMPPGTSLHVVILDFERDLAEYGAKGSRVPLITLVQGTPQPCDAGVVTE